MNATVARALKDVDPRVRYLAENALWAIWFRADSPANNATLESVAELISRRRFDEAIVLATELIGRAPGFAEAYNQRAIAEFFLGRYAESAEDCKRAIERNRFHTGASPAWPSASSNSTFVRRPSSRSVAPRVCSPTMNRSDR